MIGEIDKRLETAKLSSRRRSNNGKQDHRRDAEDAENNGLIDKSKRSRRFLRSGGCISFQAEGMKTVGCHGCVVCSHAPAVGVYEPEA